MKLVMIFFKKKKHAGSFFLFFYFCYYHNSLSNTLNNNYYFNFFGLYYEICWKFTIIFFILCQLNLKYLLISAKTKIFSYFLFIYR